MNIIFPASIGGPVWCVTGKGEDKQIVKSWVDSYTITERFANIIVILHVYNMRRTMELDAEGNILSNMDIYFSETEAIQAKNDKEVFFNVTAKDPYFTWDIWNQCGGNELCYQDCKEKLLATIDTLLFAKNTILWAELPEKDKALWKISCTKHHKKHFAEWATLRSNSYPILRDTQLSEEERMRSYIGKKVYFVMNPFTDSRWPELKTCAVGEGLVYGAGKYLLNTSSDCCVAGVYFKDENKHWSLNREWAENKATEESEEWANKICKEET